MTISITKSCKCDHCDRELMTSTSYPAHYVLELSTINTNVNNTGFAYGVHISPPIDSNKHFCGFACLTRWLESKQN